jgi:hypothetical protein
VGGALEVQVCLIHQWPEWQVAPMNGFSSDCFAHVEEGSMH